MVNELKNLNFNLDVSNKTDDFAGIYVFYNIKYFYVGQSVHVLSRIKEHQSRLRNGKHENVIIQRVYDKYKETDLYKFRPLLECDPNDLDYFEEYCFNKLKEKNPNKIPMNIAPCGQAGDVQQARINKSKSFKGKDHPWKYVKIVQLDKSGKLIKIWDSTKFAEQELGIHIHLKKHTCGGFQWQRYEEWLENPKGTVKHKHNIDDTVKQYDFEGNFIKEWKSPKEAAEKTNTNYSHLIACLKGKGKIANGFLWSYTSEAPKINLKPSRKHLRKPVKQYDLDGNFIKEWKSKNEASEVLDISLKSINNCLYGAQKQAGGFIWKN